MGIQQFGKITIDPENIEYFEDDGTWHDGIQGGSSTCLKSRLIVHLKSGRTIETEKCHWVEGSGAEYDAFKAYRDDLLEQEKAANDQRKEVMARLRIK